MLEAYRAGRSAPAATEIHQAQQHDDSPGNYADEADDDPDSLYAHLIKNKLTKNDKGQSPGNINRVLDRSQARGGK